MTGPEDILARQTRFRVDQFLGRGAYGAVYDTFDRERGRRVAVKVLRRVDAAALYRFKKEFRAVAALRHPNLVRMHELAYLDGAWLFTMDVAPGEDFHSHVRPGGQLDEARLRGALRQLAEGVLCIHAAGKLHRDLKPGNLRVDDAGHVTILDFGLAMAWQEDSLPGRSLEKSGDLLGTPSYMAPEQIDGSRPGPAADWYAVGIILYEALTGRAAFSGPLFQIIAAKRQPGPDPRGEPGGQALPADLAELCARLLCREPEARPDGEEIAAKLGARLPAVPPPAVQREAPLIGRLDELVALDGALAQSRAEQRPVIALLHGASGMGKSTLGGHFLRMARARHGALTLRGRCHERESVPYRALDALVDALVKHLATVPRPTARQLMPAGSGALVKLFPVLAAVDAFAIARPPLSQDPHTVRRQGFAALRELLGRLAAMQPLVILLDDVQWGDEDSADLLEEVLRRPGGPPLLLVASYRSGDGAAEAGCPVIATLRRLGVDVDLEVGPLSERACAQLAADLLAALGIVDGAAAERVARESAGSPFFVQALAMHAAERDRKPVSLAELLDERIDALSAPRRRLLETVAAAGGPLRFEAAARAAELPPEEAAEAATALAEASLIRTLGPRLAQDLEVFHARIREAVVARLHGDEGRRIYATLAAVLEASGECDDARLAELFRAAGDAARAACHSERAAARAAAALAFDQAVTSLRAALELSPPEERGRLQIALGQALADAGKSRESAELLLAAAEGAAAGEVPALRRRAAEELLRGGHLDEGAGEIGRALASVGLRVPATPARAVASVVWGRVKLKLRGLGFRTRAEADVPAASLARLDMCWAAAQGLGYTDLVRGMDFQVRHLLLALHAGEPYRVVRGLATEAMFLSASGDPARGAAVVARAGEVAARTGRPEARLFVELAAGITALCDIRFGDARAALARVPEIAAGHEALLGGFRWEINTAQYFELLALLYGGEVEAVARRVPEVLAEARDRGDRATEVTIATYPQPWYLLARDRPEEALRALDEALARWTVPGFHLQHLSHLIGLAEAKLYQGEPDAARAALRQAAPSMARSRVLRTRFLAVRVRDLEARVAVACARGAADPLLDEAERGARWLERQGNAWARHAASLIRGLVAHRRGQPAAELLAAAEAGAAAAEMRLHAAAIRRQRGVLAGDAPMVAGADAALRALGVYAPERYAPMIAPLSATR